MLTSKQQTQRNCRRGTSAVETALMLPLLVIVTFGAIDISQYVSSGQVVANASREAARVASRQDVSDVDAVEDAVIDYLAVAMPQMTREEISDAISVDVRVVTGVNRTTDDADEDNAYGSNEHCAESAPMVGGNTYASISGGDLSGVESGTPISVQLEFDFEAIRWLAGASYGQHSTETVSRRE